jgi:hypothetical protein
VNDVVVDVVDFDDDGHNDIIIITIIDLEFSSCRCSA